MKLIRNYRNWRRYRETVNELSRLSNRELSDLGISSAETARLSSSQPCRFRNPPNPVRRVLFCAVQTADISRPARRRASGLPI